MPKINAKNKGARMILEEWRPCPDYEHGYEVSNFGRIRKNKGSRRRPEKLVRKICKDTKGYPIISLTKNKKTTTKKVHRLVARAFIGEPPRDKPQVNHIDGSKNNNNIMNLEYMNNSENVNHSYLIGLREKQKSSVKRIPQKITFEIANIIREKIKSGVKRKVLADFYKIHVMTVGEIFRNEIWKQL